MSGGALVVQKMLALTIDWDRSSMDNREPPRDGITCGDIRQLAIDYETAIARAEAAEAALAQAHRDFGCELRDPNGTIWDYAAKLKERAEALFAAGKRVTDAFRAHGEATPYTREESRTKSECESAMLALDAAIAAQQAEGES